jgi:hypothetical protein
MRSRVRTSSTVLALLLAPVLALGIVEPATAPSAQAVSGSQFDPAYIISDQVFFDGNAMGPMDVQYFLNSKLTSCRAGYTCLKDYLQAVPAMPAEDGLCAGYTAHPWQSAAEIISRVGASCQVSPKALLVLLEKEQSLVTDSWPIAAQYTKATGFACPDTAPCDPSFGGFFYQVYNAARQLRNYGRNPASWNYRAGSVSNILFNPNADCGSSPVLIRNRATAALYNYTPYQPNAAALANLYGAGDACSAYGNRNFWRLYNDWFGPTTTALGTPEISLTTSGLNGFVTLSGWAVDPDSVLATVAVSVQIGSTWKSFVANQTGADLGTQYPGAGTNHYFSVKYPMPAGPVNVCVYLPNAGNSGITGSGGCHTVTVTDPPLPVGEVSDVRAHVGLIDISGWAVRPDAPSEKVNVAANIGSTWAQLSSGSANDVAPDRVSGAGPNQGFSGTITAAPGMQQLCIWASRSNGAPVQLNCRDVLVPGPRVTDARIESFTVTGGVATMTGWAVWPDDPSEPVHLALNIGSQWVGVDATASSATVAAVYPAAGAMHGFTVSVPVAAGKSDVCLWALNFKAAPSIMGCRSAFTATLPPSQVQLESLTTTDSAIMLSGWAQWPSQPDRSVRLATEIDGRWTPIDANTPNASVPNHGFSAAIPSPPGAHNVCLWTTVPAAAATPVSCSSVVVGPSQNTVGQLRLVVGATGGIHVEGWAARPSDPTGTVRVAANVGSQWVPFDTGVPNADAAARVTGAGPNQGFSGLIPTGTGAQRVCVWVAGASGLPAVMIGCSTVTVPASPEMVARLDTVVPVAGGVRVTGWAVWSATPTAAVNVAGNWGNAWTSIPRGLANPAADDWVAGAGPNQGFAGTIPTGSGPQTVCVWASRPSGSAAVVGCRTVTVP